MNAPESTTRQPPAAIWTDTRQWADGINRNGKPLSQEPWVRNVLADRYIETEVARLIAYNVAWMQGEGLVPNKEASMSKVFGSETVQRTTASCLEIMGMYGGLRDEKWTPLESGYAGALAARLFAYDRSRHQRSPAQHHRQPGPGPAEGVRIFSASGCIQRAKLRPAGLLVDQSVHR